MEAEDEVEEREEKGGPIREEAWHRSACFFFFPSFCLFFASFSFAMEPAEEERGEAVRSISCTSRRVYHMWSSGAGVRLASSVIAGISPPEENGRSGAMASSRGWGHPSGNPPPLVWVKVVRAPGGTASSRLWCGGGETEVAVRHVSSRATSFTRPPFAASSSPIPSASQSLAPGSGACRSVGSRETVHPLWAIQKGGNAWVGSR